MTRRPLIAALAAVAILAACVNEPDPNVAPEPIGDFRLGHNIVVAEEPTKGPLSREASDEALEEAVRAAVETRLRRFDGDGLYHVGIKVEAYVLGQPGIPILLAPKSVLLLAVNIWDNATQEKINEEPIRITAFEGANTGVPLLPSGYVKSGEEQLRNLSISAAQEIEELLRENEAAWFGPKEGRVRVAYPPRTAEGENETAETPALSLN